MKITLYALSLLLAAGSPAWSAIVNVADDESVTDQQFSDYNWDNYTHRGGLWSGCDGGSGVSPARFYLKLYMPTYVPGTYIQRATLWGFYNDDYAMYDDALHEIYMAASDTWSQSTITWNNQPGTVGNPIAYWDAAGAYPGNWQWWDITAVMDAEYRGDGTLSLCFRAQDESLYRQHWEYFCEKEYDPNLAFYIGYTIIPEPALVSLLGGLMGAAALAMGRLRR